jgi:hypothetical protein
VSAGATATARARPTGRRLGGLLLSAPEELQVEECSMTLRLPVERGEPRMVKAHQPVRTNVIVRIKRVAEDMSLAEASTAISAELAKTLPELADLASRPFRFDDGRMGRLVSYHFRPTPKVRLQQDP